jgi:hypothetical protein
MNFMPLAYSLKPAYSLRPLCRGGYLSLFFLWGRIATWRERYKKVPRLRLPPFEACS